MKSRLIIPRNSVLPYVSAVLSGFSALLLLLECLSGEPVSIESFLFDFIIPLIVRITFAVLAVKISVWKLWIIALPAGVYLISYLINQLPQISFTLFNMYTVSGFMRGVGSAIILYILSIMEAFFTILILVLFLLTILNCIKSKLPGLIIISILLMNQILLFFSSILHPLVSTLPIFTRMLFLAALLFIFLSLKKEQVSRS
jgi:hypothetical protein